MYLAMLEHKELFDKYILEKYEEENGPHFNEEYARKSVSKMHSKGAEGEHWTIEQVKEATMSYRDMLKSEITCWDLYVALNMWYHDLGANYRKRGLSDSQLIDDAITWSFLDLDAKNGKLWYYIKAMY